MTNDDRSHAQAASQFLLRHSSFVHSSFRYIPEQPGRRGCAAPALSRRLRREAPADAADPVAALSAGCCSYPRREGMRRIPANPAQTAESFQWFVVISSQFVLRLRTCCSSRLDRRRSIAIIREPFTNTTSPGRIAWPRCGRASSTLSTGNRPSSRHAGGPGAADHVPGELAAGDQQLGPADVDDLFAQLPVQGGRFVAQLAHVAADDDAPAGRVELAAATPTPPASPSDSSCRRR